MKRCKGDYIDYIKKCVVERKPSAISANISGRKCVIIELQHMIVESTRINIPISLGFYQISFWRQREEATKTQHTSPSRHNSTQEGAQRKSSPGKIGYSHLNYFKSIELKK